MITVSIPIMHRLLIKIGLVAAFLVSSLLTVTPLFAASGCSPYLGSATLNEFFKDRASQANDSDDFVEIKLLDGTIPLATYSGWTIEVCEENDAGNNNDADGCSSPVSLSIFGDLTPPWMVLKNNDIGRYVNFKTGFDAILLDANGDVIDYLSVDGVTTLEEPGCTGTALPYDYQASSPGASDKFIFRTPDGTGDWDSAESAAAPPTENSTNDTDPTTPTLTFADVTIIQGTTTATITLTLDVAATDTITIDFDTFDGSLLSGTDYTAITTTGTFLPGVTTLSFDVPVAATANTGTFNFFVGINTSTPGLASFGNHVGTVTIAPLSVDHYAISHSGTGVTCEAETVTVTAHNAAHTPVSPTNGTSVTLTATPAVDAISGAVTFNGTATAVTFTVTETTATTAPHIDLDVTDGSVTETTNTANASDDPALAFADSGFRFYGDGAYNSITSQIAGKASNVVPGNQALTLRAVRTNSNTGACMARLTGLQTIEMAFECINPTTCKSANGVTLSGTAVSDNPLGGVASYTGVDLTFDATGTAPFTLNYADAGQLTLHARKALAAATPDPAITLTGSSNPFTVVPAGLCVEAADPTSLCDPALPSCSPFVAAGDDFILTIRAVAWETAGESNSDFCSGNATTPNFQLGDIALSSTLVAPLPGNNATLGSAGFDMVAADDGNHTEVQSVSEVGVFTLTATSPSYLGETIAPSTSVNIGRFYPFDFDVTLDNAPDFIPGCSGFSYLGQPFDYNTAPQVTITARNKAGATTTNYDGVWWKLGDFTEGYAQDPLPANVTLDASGAGHTAIDCSAGACNGSFTTTFNGPLTLNRAITDIAPFDGNIDITFTIDDGDASFSANPFTIHDIGFNDGNAATLNDSQHRSGRALLTDAYGRESDPLQLFLWSNYYDGSGWVSSNDDSCTSYTATPTNPACTLLAGPIGCAAVTVSGTASHGGSFSLSAPNQRGRLGYTLTVDPWLLFDWDGDSAIDDHPTATATFGIFRGDDRILYWREVE